MTLAIKAQEDARGVDSNVLTKRAVERLQDALAVEELRRQTAFDGVTGSAEMPKQASRPIDDRGQDAKSHRETLHSLRAAVHDIGRMTRDTYLVVEDTLRFLQSI